MTREEMGGLFAKYTDEHGEFMKVNPKRTERKDLHAFLLIDELVPLNPRTPHGFQRKLLTSSSGEEVYLGVDASKVAARITEEQVLELVRCGVSFDGDSLSIFVSN